MNIALFYTEGDYSAFGPRSISAFLKKAGHRTKLIMMKSKEMSYSQSVLEEVYKLAADADIVGVSCFSRTSGKAIQILEHVRPLGKPSVWGGIHATLNPEACVGHVDVVCRGEGEGFMIELAEKLGAGGNWRDIANAAYQSDGRVVLNNPRPLIKDLDTLPMMDYSFDDEHHIQGDRIVRAHPSSGGSYAVSFNGTRGCDFRCTYCSNSRLKELACGDGHFARRISVDKLIEHAESLKQCFPGTKCINFFDEDFCARTPEEIRRFSEAYTKRVGIPFECMVSPLRMTGEKMEWLVNAGLWRINMGVESGSERTKKEIYNRHMSNEAVLRAARIINRHPNVVPYYFFIIGNPYEEASDLISTARFIAELPSPFFLRAYNLVFMPGTLLYQTAVKDGIIGGVSDSGFELDFLAGLNYKQHEWKKKNLYLNGLLDLMAGKITRRRLGLVPKAWLETLLRSGTVEFHERHTVFIRSLIVLKRNAFILRGFAATLVKRLFNNPTAVYELRKHVSSLLKKRRPRVETA